MTPDLGFLTLIAALAIVSAFTWIAAAMLYVIVIAVVVIGWMVAASARRRSIGYFGGNNVQ